MDSIKNQVWKYLATTRGYSDKIEYVKTDQQYDFLGASILRIDGSVWVLKPDNMLLKFTSGSLDFYKENGVNPQIDQLTSFYTSDETENVYLLDNANSRLVLTKKSGEYVSEYLGDKFKTASDLVVDEKEKKIYLLENSTIYQLDLK